MESKNESAIYLLCLKINCSIFFNNLTKIILLIIVYMISNSLKKDSFKKWNDNFIKIQKDKKEMNKLKV